MIHDRQFYSLPKKEAIKARGILGGYSNLPHAHMSNRNYDSLSQEGERLLKKSKRFLTPDKIQNRLLGRRLMGGAKGVIPFAVLGGALAARDVSSNKQLLEKLRGMTYGR